MYAMRLRLHELLAAHRPDVRPTGYALAQVSGGKINSTLASRLLDRVNPPKQVHFATLDALCDVIGCEPSELLARDDARPAPSGKPTVRKARPRSPRRSA